MDKKFECILKDIKSCSDGGCQSSADAICILEKCKSFIPAFFSEMGAAESIRKIYEKLKEPEYGNIQVSYIDIMISDKLYTEYYDGMNKFIDEIFGHSEASTDVHENIQRAMDNDSTFIESLFNGQNNKMINGFLTECIGNIEYLIDFIPKLESFINRCKSIGEKYDECENGCCSDCCSLVWDSVIHYSINVLNMVSHDYCKIVNSLEETPCEDSSEPRFDNINTDSFRMF